MVLSKRRFTYEQEIAENPLNYDAWFDYIKLEESTGNHDRIREVGCKPDGVLPVYVLLACWRVIVSRQASGAL